MKSDRTFKEEFNWLLQHLPEALRLEPASDIKDLISNHFENFEFITLAEPLEIIRLDDDYFEGLFADTHVLIKNTKSDDFFSMASHSETFDAWQIEELIIEMGNEAFGFYLPMHKFFGNWINNWGIYLFPDLIEDQARRLQSYFKKDISIEDCTKLYKYCVYRHELFHYQTEKYATAQEVLMRLPFYLIYLSNIYSKYAKTEDWLEEALAEASVLSSRLVTNRSGINKKLLRKIYEFDLKRMPPGYSDYKCQKYNGPKVAHQFLASQIVHGEKFRPTTTGIFTIKSNFISNDKLVPVYEVRGIKVKRIQ